MIANRGYEAYTHPQGEGAFEQALLLGPDLILLDINMPDISGYEVCALLKSNDETKHIPVIFISSSNDIGDKVYAFDSGAVDYITKPFHAAEVLARIDSHLQLKAIQLELQSRIKREEELRLALEASNAELRRLSMQDYLTGLYNRRFLEDYLQKLTLETQGAAKDQGRDKTQRINILMLDIDNFKAINDDYGHHIGDKVLKHIADLCEGALELNDIAARYGGEEFVLVLVKKTAEQAANIAETLRLKAEAFPWEDIALELEVTISIGVSSTSKLYNFEELIAEADASLYIAKNEGKNRVSIHPNTQDHTKDIFVKL